MLHLALFGVHLPPRVALLLTLGFIVFPFSARNSGKAQCQRRALASTSLADAHLLKILHPVAQYLGLTRERRRFGRKRGARWMRALSSRCL